MRRIQALCATLLMATTTAAAQPAPPEAPPPGTLATIHESHSQNALGDRRDHVSTTYRDSTGVTKDSKTSSVSVQPPPPVTSTTATSTQTVTTPR